jgi:hypothetical protein
LVLVCRHRCHLVSSHAFINLDSGIGTLTRLRIASGGISTFGSLIVRDFGYKNFDAILFNIPFGAIQFFVIIGAAWAATHWQKKGLTIAAVSTLPALGAIIMLTVPRTPENKGALLFGYYLVRARSESKI